MACHPTAVGGPASFPVWSPRLPCAIMREVGTVEHHTPACRRGESVHHDEGNRVLRALPPAHARRRGRPAAGPWPSLGRLRWLQETSVRLAVPHDLEDVLDTLVDTVRNG